MIILLLAAWVLGGLLVALVVGGAVRIADAASDVVPTGDLVEVEVPVTA